MSEGILKVPLPIYKTRHDSNLQALFSWIMSYWNGPHSPLSGIHSFDFTFLTLWFKTMEYWGNITTDHNLHPKFREALIGNSNFFHQSLSDRLPLSLKFLWQLTPPPSTPHPPNLSLTLCWNHTRRRPENCSHDTSVFIKKISWNNYMFWPLTRVTRLQCRLYNYFWCRKHISQQCVVKRIWSKYLGDYKSLMPLYFSFTFLWVNVQWCLN